MNPWIPQGRRAIKGPSTITTAATSRTHPRFCYFWVSDFKLAKLGIPFYLRRSQQVYKPSFSSFFSSFSNCQIFHFTGPCATKVLYWTKPWQPCPNLFRLVQIGQDLSKVVQTWPDWLVDLSWFVQNHSDWSRLGQTSQDSSTLVLTCPIW